MYQPIHLGDTKLHATLMNDINNAEHLCGVRSCNRSSNSMCDNRRATDHGNKSLRTDLERHEKGPISMVRKNFILRKRKKPIDLEEKRRIHLIGHWPREMAMKSIPAGSSKIPSQFSEKKIRRVRALERPISGYPIDHILRKTTILNKHIRARTICY
jgi:hypothetical protein